MPQLAVAVSAAAAFFATPIGSLVLLGAVAAVSYLLNGTAQPEESAGAPGGVEFDASVGEDVPVDAIFGRSATPGQRVHQQVYGTDNEYLKLVYVIGTGVHDGLQGLFVEGKATTLSGSNSDPHGRVVDDFTTSGTPHLWVKFYDGSMDQAADAQLVAKANPAGRWTSDHRLAGHAYAIVTLRYDEELFQRRVPSFLFDVRGLRMYDWRKDPTQPGGDPLGTHVWGDPSTYEWTANPAVCAYNYKRGVWLNGVLILGDGASDFDLDLARFTAAANLSDEDVSYPETGRTLDRYKVGVRVKDNMDSKSVMRVFEEAMGGFGVEIGGKYGPVPAETGVPVMTITDADLQLGHPKKAQKHLPPGQTYTAVQGTFSDPSQGWQSTPYGIRADAAVDAAQGGRRTRAMDLDFVYEYEQAQALAEIARRRDLYDAHEVCVVRHKFVRLEPGDQVTRTSSLFGSISMTVESREELEDGSVQLSLRQWDNAIVPDSSLGFLDLPIDPGPTLPAPVLATTVLGLTATAVPITGASTSDVRAGIRVSWDTITDPTVVRVLVRYWPDTETESEAQTAIVDQSLSASSTVLMGVVPQTVYHIKATIVTDPVRATAWSGAVDVLTGSEVYTTEAEVADQSVTLQKLSADLQRITGLLSTDDPDGVFGLIQAALDEIERQAAANLDANAAVVRKTELLAKQLLGAAAAVVFEREARVEQGLAFSSALLEVSAQIDDAIANGLADSLLKFEASVDGSGSTATIAAKVRVTNEADYSSAAWILQATADGLGGTTSAYGVFASKFFVVDEDGTTMENAFVFEGGVAKLNVLRAGRITSADGTSMVIDFDDPEIYMEA